MSALYAFCREVDDVADDESVPVAERRIATAPPGARMCGAPVEGGKHRKFR